MIEEHSLYFQKDEKEKIDGTVYIIPGNPDKGFNFNYAVYIPTTIDEYTSLLMYSCNTGGNVPIKLDEAIDIAKKSTYTRPHPGIWHGSNLNLPVLIPLVPRVRSYYTQALGSAVFKNDVSFLREAQEHSRFPLTEDEIEEIREYCYNIPEQVVNIIEDAKNFLKEKGIEVDDKVIAEGYSAGSKFANYFTALHPELVKCVVAGGTSGLPIIPLKELNGVELNFPLGVNDLPNFNYEEFSKIPQLYYIGDKDFNDPAMPAVTFITDEQGEYIIEGEDYKVLRDEEGNIIPRLGENGELIPRYGEGYSVEEMKIIHTYLGTNPQNRFDYNQILYEQCGINAEFVKLPGTHNTVTMNYDEFGRSIVNNLVEEFITRTLETELTNKRV